MGFFSTFFDWASVLFSSDPAASKKKRDLKLIENQLRMVKPAIYKSQSHQVLPGFAQQLLNLVNALRPLQELLEKTVLLPNSRLARRYLDAVLERSLGPGLSRLLESCSYEALSAKTAAGADPAAAVATAEDDFRLALKSLEGPEARRADAEMAEFEAFLDLCRYDYGRILSSFDPAARPESASYKGHFNAVPGAELAAELSDLLSVLGAVHPGSATVESLAAVAELLGGSDAAGVPQFSKGISAVNRVLSSTLSVPVLTSLLRAVREDPTFVPSGDAPARSTVAEYRDRLGRRWAEERDRFLREKKESALSSEIASLYGSPPQLLSITGLDDDLLRRLQAEHSLSLAWMRPLALSKTFEARFVAGELLTALRRLAIEGFFQNSVLRTRLTDAVGSLEKMSSRISLFEESVAANSRSGAGALRTAMNEAAAGKDRGDAIERLSRNLDDRARELVTNDAKQLRVMAEAVFDVLNDFKKPTPELVTNIKTLAASKDKALLPTLVKGYNNTAKFLKILQAYMVIPALASERG